MVRRVSSTRARSRIYCKTQGFRTSRCTTLMHNWTCFRVCLCYYVLKHFFPKQLSAVRVLAVLIKSRWWFASKFEPSARPNPLCFHRQNSPHLHHSHTELLFLSLKLPKPYENTWFSMLFLPKPVSEHLRQLGWPSLASQSQDATARIP